MNPKIRFLLPYRKYIEYGLSTFSLCQTTHATLASLGSPLDFDPLQEFQLHLEEKYEGFRRDQMQRIQSFWREKNDTPHLCT